MFESNASKKLVGAAKIDLTLIFDDHAPAIQLCGELFDVAHHHAADPLPSQLARHHDALDAQRLGTQFDADDRDDVAEELTEQSPCRDGGGGGVNRQERAYGCLVGGLDRADKEAKATHGQGPGSTAAQQHSSTAKG